MTMLVAVPLLEAKEQEQSLYQLEWEYHDWILQNETLLSQGSSYIIRWSGTSEMLGSQLSQLFHLDSPNLLLVLYYNELSQVSAAGTAL